jgi:predicted molibdopterin-dependent oxidoreductase YjgC
MKGKELDDLRLTHMKDDQGWVEILVNNKPVRSRRGESLASALLAAGYKVFRHTHQDDFPRGIYCGMGECFECLVQIDQGHRVRACMTKVKEGLSLKIDFPVLEERT